jgi:16S rRNA (guanine(966)-N(2))-methyltransferase RsmD
VLAEFEGVEVRPTSDRTKEALFNILYTKVYDARVLDLFCGSGSLGIECISRGASEVVFNDVRRESIALVKKNLEKIKETGILFNLDYMALLKRITPAFDLIFLDPPYKEEFGISALREIAKRNLLKEDGIVIYERDRKFEGEVEGLTLYDERKYGKSYLAFFKKGE